MSQVDPRDVIQQPEASFAPGLLLSDDFAMAFAAAQAEFPPIQKNKTAKVRSERTGSSYEFSYADLTEILDKVRPPLARHGIAISQPIRYREGKPFVVTCLLHRSAEWASDGLPLPTQVEPQKMGGYLSYYRRYDMCSLLGISAEDEETSSVAVEPASRRKGRASGEGATPEEPGYKQAQAPSEITAAERSTYIEGLKKFRDVVGPDPLKRFVLSFTGAADAKKIDAKGWEKVTNELELVSQRGEQALIALVNGD